MKRISTHLMMLTMALAMALPIATEAKEKQQRIYKWIDKNGITHYSTQPPKGIKSSQVNIRASSPAKSPRPASKQATKKPKPLAPPKQNIKNPELCEQAKARLTILETHNRVRLKDSKTDEWRFLTESEKQADIVETKKRIKEYCK